jgi:transposase-like protein
MQSYHANATTNVHIRTQIQSNHASSNQDLATQFGVCTDTISKWRNRNFTSDVSSAPKNIVYTLTPIENALVVSIRSASWLPLDEVFETLYAENKSITRSSIYRCFVKNNINQVPQIQKDKAKKFKAYKPGYLHIDVTYLPKFDGKATYLFVAIDRATRILFYQVYDNKEAASTDDFFDKCVAYFSFKITHILTDNGLEFTNRLIRSKTGNLCTKLSLLDLKCTTNDIKHRLTKPSTPQTNGMVERVNGTIKNNTILKNKYENLQEMNQDLMAFLSYYNLYRRHGSLRKELNVKTPFEAMKKWYEIEPSLFRVNPNEFEQNLTNIVII